MERILITPNRKAFIQFLSFVEVATAAAAQ